MPLGRNFTLSFQPTRFKTPLGIAYMIPIMVGLCFLTVQASYLPVRHVNPLTMTPDPASSFFSSFFPVSSSSSFSRSSPRRDIHESRVEIIVGLSSSPTRPPGSAISITGSGTSTASSEIMEFLQDPATTAAPQSKSIFEILDSDHRFTTLMEYVTKSDSTGHQLKNATGELTVFAPTNAAFAALDRLYPGKHFEDYDVDDVLHYHMIPTRLTRDDLFHGRLIQSLYQEKHLGRRMQQIRVQRMDQYVLLNRYSKVEEHDLAAANGIIHVLDAVLIPPPNMFEELSVVPTEFSITTTALLLTGVDKQIQSQDAITFFAPNNMAWQSLGQTRLMNLFDPSRRETLREIMLYHISPTLLYTFDMTRIRHEILPTALLGYVLKVESQFEASNQDASGINQRSQKRVLLQVNQSPVAFHDAIAKNGNLHILEKVLCPCENRLPVNWTSLVC